MKKTILLIDAGYLHPTLREEGIFYDANKEAFMLAHKLWSFYACPQALVFYACLQT
jgi:hypothetical protein